MSNTTHRRITAISLAAAAGFIAIPASAQESSTVASCINSDNNAAPSVAIRACTIEIQSGRWRGKELAWALSNRCVAYLANGDNERALADCTRAILLAPDGFTAFRNRGLVYYQLHNYDHAIDDASQAIELSPQFADAYYDRAVAYVQKGDYKSAIADYDQTLRLKPDDTEAVEGRKAAYKAAGR